MKTDTAVCTTDLVSLVSHRNYRCRPRRISCPFMLALLTGYNILQYNSKGLWKVKIISIAAEGTTMAEASSSQSNNTRKDDYPCKQWLKHHHHNQITPEKMTIHAILKGILIS
ncbi:uncharacterized protein [Acropora muricata]|uniref:uncharacterized protein n=1 Tax=Acropora muricata TaxID=159855 RepID=UPI0034E3B372